MIVLFTDYGVTGPYTGQLEIVLHARAPEVPVVNLCSDLPRQNPKAAAYLLAALQRSLPQPGVWLCVVDPGVGTWQDRAAMLNFDGIWYVGPDNGLFDLVGRRADHRSAYEIRWRPETLSSSFHGRDLYAPVAAELARQRRPAAAGYAWRPRHDWPDDLPEIIYIDAFGNAMTGLRSDRVDTASRLQVGGRRLRYAETFGAVAPGGLFWYRNSCGLVEIACNQGRADQQLDLAVGTPVRLLHDAA